MKWHIVLSYWRHIGWHHGVMVRVVRQRWHTVMVYGSGGVNEVSGACWYRVVYGFE